MGTSVGTHELVGEITATWTQIQRRRPDRIAVGAVEQAGDGSWTYRTRPAGEVTGWVVCCDCALGDTMRHATWVGPTFQRVPSKYLENLRELRLFAPDEDVADISDREDVEESALDVWGADHVFGAGALREIAAARVAAERARLRLATAWPSPATAAKTGPASGAPPT